MKGDGHVGGQLYLTAKDKVPQKKVSKREKRFTLIGFTALTGEPVMAVIIIKGTQPRFDVELGIDIRKTPIGDETDPDFIDKNTGSGKYFPGGPTCHFRGKDVPSMIRWHESGSITSEILTEALQTMDFYNLFPRNDPSVKPFMLLDGHGSRLELPFIKYINNPADHWIVCLGVLYGTALWQVSDSKEQNGSFNIAMTKAKQDLLEYREMLSMPGSLESTDMMPLINRAWDKSFARVQKNKQAIADRGWLPYNRNIMTFAEIRETMTAQEIQDEADSSNVIIPSSQYDTHSSATTITAISSSTENSSKPASISDVNISKGNASFCITSIIQHKDMLEAREKIQKQQVEGLGLRDRLKKSKKLTAGVLYKNGSARIGATTLMVLPETKREKLLKEQEKLKKERDTYLKLKEEAETILQSGVALDKMSIKKLKTLVKLHKIRSDGAMPTKKEALIEKYKQWKDRPPPVFTAETNSLFVDDVEANMNDNDSDDEVDPNNTASV